MRTSLHVSKLRRNRFLQRSGLLLAAVVWVPLAQAAPYDFTTISMPGATDTSVYGINDKGAMVGAYSTASGTSGFLDNAGNFTTINVPGSGNSDVAASGINNSGEIVGSYLSTNNPDGMMVETFGFTDTAGTFAAFKEPLSYGGGTNASGINSHGDIVGTYAVYGGSGVIDGFRFSGNQYTTMNGITNSSFPYNTNANGINDNGMIVGKYFSGWNVDPSTAHGFVSNGSTYTTLDFPAAAGTTPYGINNNGVIVGSYSTAGKNVGFVDNGGKFTALQVPGAINTMAYGINDQGTIVGSYATDKGNFGFMATPVPEPSILAQLGTGLLMMGSLHYLRRRRGYLQPRTAT